MAVFLVVIFMFISLVNSFVVLTKKEGGATWHWLVSMLCIVMSYFVGRYI